MEKITYVQALTIAIALVDSAVDNDPSMLEVSNKLNALKALTERRNNAKSKAEVAKQETNSALKDTIIEVLKSATEPVTITELTALDSRLEGYKPQKLSPLMHSLVKEGKVIRTEAKHKAYFAIA